MGVLEISQKTRAPIDFEEHVKLTGERVLDAAAHAFKVKFAARLKDKLSNTQFSFVAMEKYPWLQDAHLGDYIVEALYVVSVGSQKDELAVMVSRASLAAKGIHEDALEILEFGDVFVPGLFVIRSTIAEVASTSLKDMQA
jgi:hypothetical protein